MKPSISILNKEFRWVPSAKTDVGATIRREQRRLKAEAEAKADIAKNVTPMRKKAPG